MTMTPTTTTTPSPATSMKRTRKNHHLQLSRHGHNMFDAASLTSQRFAGAVSLAESARAGAGVAVKEALFGRLFENAPVAMVPGKHAPLVERLVTALESTGALEALQRSC
jgi:hypothetical protein